MKISSAASIVIALAGTVVAQQVYTIDPSNVSNTTRDAWCTSQTTQCPLICLQTPGNTGAEVNTCDPNALQYQCICTNGLSPNLTVYSLTLPYFICQEWTNECVANCGSNNTCSSDCRQDHPCGAQTPSTVTNSTSSNSSTTKTSSASGAASTSAAKTTAAGTIYSGLAGATASASTGGSSGLQPFAIHFGQTSGLLVVMAGLFGGFAFLL